MESNDGKGAPLSHHDGGSSARAERVSRPRQLPGREAHSSPASRERDGWQATLQRVHQTRSVDALAECHLPMRTARFIGIEDVPHAAQSENRQSIGQTDSHGAPTGFRRAVESYGRFRVGMPLASLTRLERLDPTGLKLLDRSPDTAIQFPRNEGRSFGIHGRRTHGAGSFVRFFHGRPLARFGGMSFIGVGAAMRAPRNAASKRRLVSSALNCSSSNCLEGGS
jgi:hypothetical protein